MTRSMYPLGLAAFSYLMAASGAAAQQPPPAPISGPVKLTLDAGFVNAAGNTNVTTLNLGDNFEYRGSSMGFAQFANVVYGRTGDSTTAEQIKGGLRVERKLVSVLHAFVGLTYERNRFAGLSRRFEEHAGLSLRMIDRPSDLWTFETGSSVNQQRSVANVVRNFLSLRFATLFRHNFTKTAYLSESAEFLPSMENSQDYLVNSETAVVVPVAGIVALKVSYLVKFDHLPEPGFRRSDRVLSTGLQITF